MRGLADFVRGAWHIVEPSTPLRWGWHIDAVCAELEAVTRGEVRELVICLPPGHMKSLLVSVFWPAWQWLHKPGERTIFLANDESLTVRDSRRTRLILTDPWYRGLVLRAAIGRGEAALGEVAGCEVVVDTTTGDPFEPWQLADDQNQKANYATTSTGVRHCLSMWGRITGKRAHGAVLDDPYDAKEVLFGGEGQVGDRMRRAVEVYDGALASRLDEPRYRVVIMQRLHEADLAGVLISRGVRAVVLPAAFDPEHPDRYEHDPRTEAGELLFGAVHSAARDADLRTALGDRGAAAQLDQRPSPASGGMFHAAWFRYGTWDPQRFAAVPGNLDEVAATVDCSFRKTATSDYVVLQVWGRKGDLSRGGRAFLLDQVRARMELPETERALLLLAKKWPQIRLFLIETKANGDALIQVLRHKLGGLVGYDPRASKEARAQVSALAFEAGQIELPDPIMCPWVRDYVDEHLAFPAGANDDQVDATAQLMIRWTGGERLDPLQRLSRELGAFL